MTQFNFYKLKKDDTKSTLFLFTANYPYGTGESFIQTELAVLSSHFSNVCIFPLNSHGTSRAIPSNAEVIKWQEGYTYNGIRIFYKHFLFFFSVLLPEFLRHSKKIRTTAQFSELRSILLQNIARAEHIKKYIDQYKSDKNVFYTFWFNDWATILGILKKKKDIPAYYSRAHGYDLYSERRENGFIPYRNFQLKTIKHIFTVSKDGMNYLIKKFPSYASKIKLNHLGIMDNGINPFVYDNQLILVSCSNLIPLKRVHLMIEILKNVHQNVYWIHFGDGPLKQDLLETSKQLPGNIHINFKGQINNNDIITFYKTHPVHLMVLLSETEGGVPISLQEAASFGIPLLGTNAGGIPEIVTEETGILVPVDLNITEVSRLINEFGSSFRNTEEFRLKCRKFWKRSFDAEKNYELFYKQLMED